ncbi:ATP-binding protein [Streptomyces sp. AK02-01A]|uniref:ATP-binding protein n=1 Tax=Streptomyces sp. AK02-01A TaxID=3028648 RepID=UPI0029B7D438|nr:ATP-binding protein [Streptomyces sp. AK02-01A]MDX3854213.1 ATP-binding protein [Streptomyces sp. AK02-01A]
MANTPSPASRNPPTHWVLLAGQAEPLAVARERVRDLLADVVSCVDDAVLVTSELVGNAVRHTAAGPDRLTIEIDAHHVVVSVHDSEDDRGGVRPPALSDRDPLAESGRGLRLVEMLTRRWYVEATATGKAVVAVLPRREVLVSRGAGS